MEGIPLSLFFMFFILFILSNLNPGLSVAVEINSAMLGPFFCFVTDIIQVLEHYTQILNEVVEEITEGGLHVKNLTQILAELEREVFNKNYLKAIVLKEYLQILNSYTVEELCSNSKYDRLSIEQIVNYWRGL